MSSCTPVLRVVLAAAGLPLLAPGARAQCPNQWEAAPLQSLPGTYVKAAEAFDDGNGLKLWASIAGGQATQLARWDRERWTFMGVVENGPFVGLEASLLALEPCDLGSGKSLYALGFYERIGGIPFNSIARWNGSAWVALGSGLRIDAWEPAVATAATVFDDGSGPQLYVGGVIGTASGTPVANIARWNGSSWSAVGSGLNATVNALAVFDDGSGLALYAGGDFTQAGGQPASHVARWDGSSWSNVGAGCSGKVLSLEVFDDGTGAKLIAGGQFLQAGGGPAAGVAAWNGSSWSALGAGLGGASMSAHALAVRNEGGGPALYAGGTFSAAGGASVSNVARWDGASWTALDGGTNGLVYGFSEWSVCAHGAPDLLAHGYFGAADGKFAHCIALWSAGSWSPLSPSSGANGIVYTSLTWNDGSGPALYAGGSFQRIGPDLVARLGRWEGNSWSSVGGGMNGDVHELLVWNDGSGERLYAGGTFTLAGGVPAVGVARWNGSVWEPLGAGIAGTVRALHVHDDGSGTGPVLYAAGKFNDLHHVKRWHNGAWESMGFGVYGGSSFDSGGWSMVSYALPGESKSLMVGTGPIDGFNARGIRRWDGSAWSTFASASGTVMALAVWSEPLGPERLYAGGYFVQIGPIAANSVARFDGALWLPLSTGMQGTVEDFEVWNDGTGESLYVGGGFPSAGGVAGSGVARWDGSSFHALDGGLGGPSGAGTVRTISKLPAQDGLFVGGSLFDVLGSPTSNLAWWLPDCSAVPYCATSPNSAGPGAAMSTGGSTSVCASDFTLQVSGAPKNILGAFYYGPQAVQVPFGNGFRCVGGGTTGIFRLLPVSNSGASGTASRTLDFSQPPVGSGPGQILPGSTWCFQFWYRDPAGGGSGFNLSDAVQATFVP